MSHGFAHVGSQPIFSGHVITVEVNEFESPTGERFTRDTVRTPGAVVVVPIIVNDAGGLEVVMIKQWRASVDRVLWELPAGLRDVADEPPETTAHRELIEEVGYKAATIEPLAVTLASPGFTNATHHYFLATNLHYVGTDLQGPEELAMETVLVSLSQAKAMAITGEIDNGPAVIGLLLACERLTSTHRWSGS